MSTGQREPRRNARPYTVDEDTIRTRSANPDAAEYTLYVRSLINDYLGFGGQAKVLEHAHNRGLHYPGLNRQKLSEQLSRYRRGPTWEMTELIIACLPDSCDTAGIRALAAGWYQCARGHLPDGYNGPVSRPPGKPGQRNVPESEPAIPVLQRQVARLQERLRAETERHVSNLRTSENARNQAVRQANQLEVQFHQVREELLRVRSIAAEIATIREEYARQCVALELLAAPGLRTTPIIDLPQLPATHRRIRFGLLVATIDAQAPPTRRALARYLCVYAEFAGIPPAELATRADIATAVTTDILAGRHVPTAAHATRLADVLHCEPDTLRHLISAAGSSTALDEDFWSIARSVDTPPPPETPPTAGGVVGMDPDNPVTRPHPDPTTPLATPIVDRLRQVAALHQQGVISDGEHAEQRARILGEL
ncbi:helix-turn-helix domain-containing protein [Micromonospora sp. CPCC 205558]|uniref:helix-turn-helix domain-containing protein n=1 Tax=Micromonospora sp. CPCC 205558 TaxID=3122403 RepID=UPI002FEFDA2A